MSTCHILFLNTNKWLIQQVLTFILQLSFLVSIFLAIFVLCPENISAFRRGIAMYPILYNKYLIKMYFTKCNKHYWTLIQHIPLYSTKPKVKISYWCIDLVILQAHANQERFWCSLSKLSVHFVSSVYMLQFLPK